MILSVIICAQSCCSSRLHTNIWARDHCTHSTSERFVYDFARWIYFIKWTEFSV